MSVVRSRRRRPYARWAIVTAAAAACLHLAAGSALAAGHGSDAAQAKARPTGQLILGEIESVTVTNLDDPSSGGVIVVKGKRITIPDNLSIGLPAGRMTLRNLVLDGPKECTSLQPVQSGLAVSDTCRTSGSPALARVMVLKDSATTLARMRPPGSPRAMRAKARSEARQQQK